MSDRTTDGWRGRPGAAWSDADILTQALAHVLDLPRGAGSVAIGFDGRGGSDAIATALARLVANAGVDHVLSSASCPTPALGRYVASHPEVALGVMVTASHNPPGDIGLKVRGGDGFASVPPPPEPDLDLAALLDRVGNVVVSRSDDILRSYRTGVGERLQAAADDFVGDVTFDLSWGACGGVLQAGGGLQLQRAVPMPFFLGTVPDPVHVEAAEPLLRSAVAQSPHPADALALMTDGDGDRIVAYTHRLGYVNAVELGLALLMTVPEVSTVISTQVAPRSIDHAGGSAGRQVVRTRVGFKNVVAAWKDLGCPPALGLEPNGGVAVAVDRGDYFERDGFSVAAAVLRAFPCVADLDEAVAQVRRGQRFPQELFSLHCDSTDIMGLVANRWSAVEVRNENDTVEVDLGEAGRVCIRASGTEPVLRLYVEGDQDLVSWFRALVSSPGRHEGERT